MENKQDPICVRHRDGWCIAKNQSSLDYNDNMQTKCGYVIWLPWQIDRRKPTCKDCIDWMNLPDYFCQECGMPPHNCLCSQDDD